MDSPRTVTQCPRCKGNLYRNFDEPTCLMCGYVDYGTPEPKRPQRWADVPPSWSEAPPVRECETEGCSGSLDGRHTLARFCDPCQGAKARLWRRMRRLRD